MYKSISEYGVQPEQKQDQHEVGELENPNHKAQVINNNRIVVIDIYADWCGPCKQTAPTYAILAKQFSQVGYCAIVKYKFENMSDAERAQVHGIPVFEFYVDRRKVSEITGADLDAVEKKLRQILTSASAPSNQVVDLRAQRASQGVQGGSQSSQGQYPPQGAPQGYQGAPQRQYAPQGYPQGAPQSQYPPQGYPQGGSQSSPGQFSQPQGAPQGYQNAQNVPPTQGPAPMRNTIRNNKMDMPVMNYDYSTQNPQPPTQPNPYHQPYQSANNYSQFSYSQGADPNSVDMYKS